jgi:hypothetical protein
MSMSKYKWQRYVGQVHRSLDESDCNCGGADHSQIHRINEDNPTGHAVTCPVYLRWRSAQSDKNAV